MCACMKVTLIAETMDNRIPAGGLRIFVKRTKIDGARRRYGGVRGYGYCCGVVVFVGHSYGGGET